MRKLWSAFITRCLMLISLLPMWVFWGISDISYLLLYHIIGYRKNVVFKNLRDAFPQKSDHEIKKMAKAFFRHFVDYFYESIKSMRISKSDYMKRMKVLNPELLDNYYAQNKSIILYCAHYANWEWLASFQYITKHQVISFYQSLSNKFFEEIVKDLREHTGLVAINSTKAFKAMMDYNRRNILTFTYMAGDQCPPGYSPKYWTTFLNQDTAFLLGADHIARRTNQVVIFPFITKVKRGYYEVVFEVLHENPKELKEFELIEIFATHLEKQILNEPHLWLWSHKRWKLKKSDWVKDEEEVEIGGI